MTKNQKYLAVAIAGICVVGGVTPVVIGVIQNANKTPEVVVDPTVEADAKTLDEAIETAYKKGKTISEIYTSLVEKDYKGKETTVLDALIAKYGASASDLSKERDLIISGLDDAKEYLDTEADLKISDEDVRKATLATNQENRVAYAKANYITLDANGNEVKTDAYNEYVKSPLTKLPTAVTEAFISAHKADLNALDTRYQEAQAVVALQESLVKVSLAKETNTDTEIVELSNQLDVLENKDSLINNSYAEYKEFYDLAARTAARKKVLTDAVTDAQSKVDAAQIIYDAAVIKAADAQTAYDKLVMPTLGDEPTAPTPVAEPTDAEKALAIATPSTSGENPVTQAEIDAAKAKVDAYTQYEKDLAAYNTAKAAYDKEAAAYPTKLVEYIADEKVKAKELSDAKEALSTAESDLKDAKTALKTAQDALEAEFPTK